MSLRTNLATRPFYNERAVRAIVALAALVVVGMTVFNLSRLVSLTARDRELGAQASAAEARARDLGQQVARLRTGIDARHVDDIAAAAHEANLVIDQRAFSWTDLLNRLEASLPPTARVTAIKPSVDDEGRLTVTVTVLARSVDAIDRFLEALERTGWFSNLLSQQESGTKEGLIKATVEGGYRPPPAVPAGGAR
jgi:Tfp pilus assembly protein PilN